LQEHHVAAEPVERFRVDAAAVPAERPWCLDLSAAAVLAWFGGDEHYVETLHVPAIMVLGERALHLFGGGFRFFTLNSVFLR
jgi:hypothetical protein